MIRRIRRALRKFFWSEGEDTNDEDAHLEGLTMNKHQEDSGTNPPANNTRIVFICYKEQTPEHSAPRRDIRVRGSWDNWSKPVPLQPHESIDGMFCCWLQLELGRRYYFYRYIDYSTHPEHWFNDPSQPMVYDQRSRVYNHVLDMQTEPPEDCFFPFHPLALPNDEGSCHMDACLQVMFACFEGLEEEKLQPTLLATKSEVLKAILRTFEENRRSSRHARAYDDFMALISARHRDDATVANSPVQSFTKLLTAIQGETETKWQMFGFGKLCDWDRAAGAKREYESRLRSSITISGRTGVSSLQFLINDEFSKLRRGIADLRPYLVLFCDFIVSSTTKIETEMVLKHFYDHADQPNKVNLQLFAVVVNNPGHVFCVVRNRKRGGFLLIDSGKSWWVDGSDLSRNLERRQVSVLVWQVTSRSQFQAQQDAAPATSPTSPTDSTSGTESTSSQAEPKPVRAPSPALQPHCSGVASPDADTGFDELARKVEVMCIDDTKVTSESPPAPSQEGALRTSAEAGKIDLSSPATLPSELPPTKSPLSVQDSERRIRGFSELANAAQLELNAAKNVKVKDTVARELRMCPNCLGQGDLSPLFIRDLRYVLCQNCQLTWCMRCLLEEQACATAKAICMVKEVQDLQSLLPPH